MKFRIYVKVSLGIVFHFSSAFSSTSTIRSFSNICIILIIEPTNRFQNLISMLFIYTPSHFVLISVSISFRLQCNSHPLIWKGTFISLNNTKCLSAQKMLSPVWCSLHLLFLMTFGKAWIPIAQVANVFDIVASEFKIQLHHYVYFQNNTLGKGMDPLIPPAMG